MRTTDIAIIGGGLAGSIAAAMLGRMGITAVLIDPHPKYPPDFRAEKLSGTVQLDRFRRTGLADATLPSLTHDGENWIARYGYLLDRSPSQQHGVLYEDLVNLIRDQIPSAVEIVAAKATGVATSADRQTVTLSTGETVSARLVVMANGLNVGLRHSLGIERDIISPSHSISLAFDIAPVGRPAFDFAAMTYFSEHPSDRAPYLTIFPIKDVMRANLFVYRPTDDPWLRQMRQSPTETLNALYPRLSRLTGAFEARGPVKVRPIDLYVSKNYVQPGIVLVGDAFQCPDPVTGTGTDKVFTDVTQLCNVHIPQWLASPGMGAEKIAAFYDDPVKKACDEWALAQAFSFRAVTLEPGLYWKIQRLARAALWLSRGALRWLTQSLGSHPTPPAPRAPGSAQSSRA
jgi:2-polyprenyl-6-methoxyphenol hydroxylase-like FAD-dependent oxidoreductase